MLIRLIVLLCVLVHLFIHLPEPFFYLPRCPVNGQNEVKYQPVGQVEDKNKEKKS
jgi:hypothetical protein